MFALFFCHWYVNGAVPVAVAEKVAELPTVTLWLAGWTVNAGAVGVGVGVEDVVLLVLPAQLHSIAAKPKRKLAAAYVCRRFICIRYPNFYRPEFQKSSEIAKSQWAGSTTDIKRTRPESLDAKYNENTCTLGWIWSSVRHGHDFATAHKTLMTVSLG
jgi:hypothetical protein